MNKMNNYNIIGDIHGRVCWKDLVIPDAINVFVGDYFDPYDDYSYEQLMRNFQEILQFKIEYPANILLLGNHDLHYLHYNDSSRLDRQHSKEIQEAIMSNIHLFQLALSIDNRVLVTHAGVTNEWLDLTEYDGPHMPDLIEKHINNLFLDGLVETSDGQCYYDPNVPYGLSCFTFSKCSTGFDIFGNSPTQSPVWVRPQTLVDHNALPDYTQIVGHTQVDHIEQIPYPVWLVDCLGQKPGSLLLKINNDIIEYVCNNLPTSQPEE